MVSGLVSAGWPLPEGKFKQPEDNLLEFIRSSPAVQKRWDAIDPKHKIPPNQWHELLCLGTNLWLEHQCGPKIELVWDLTTITVKEIIDNGGTVVVSGRFKDEKIGEIGHIVTVVGYQTSDESVITHMILDDPWGDYETMYKVQRGDDVFMPLSDWYSMIKECNMPKKFGHVIKQYCRA
jgi:hypothetical protein